MENIIMCHSHGREDHIAWCCLHESPVHYAKCSQGCGECMRGDGNIVIGNGNIVINI